MVVNKFSLPYLLHLSRMYSLRALRARECVLSQSLNCCFKIYSATGPFFLCLHQPANSAYFTSSRCSNQVCLRPSNASLKIARPIGISILSDYFRGGKLKLDKKNEFAKNPQLQHQGLFRGKVLFPGTRFKETAFPDF